MDEHWGDLFVHIATCTGWTFEEIERLTMWEVRDLRRYWRKFPPLHVLKAWQLGIGPRERRRGTLSKETLAAFGATRG